jgi:hypothetical protein
MVFCEIIYVGKVKQKMLHFAQSEAESEALSRK